MAKATAKAIGRNRNSPMPGIKASGASTRNVQSVETSSGIATSLAPRKAASFGSSPKPKCRCVFSRQMIALSTSGPIASASPASVITLIVMPTRYRQMIAPSTETGIVMMAIIVIRHSPRKSRMTSEQRIAPSTPSCTRAAIDSRT